MCVRLNCRVSGTGEQCLADEGKEEASELSAKNTSVVIGPTYPAARRESGKQWRSVPSTR